VEESASDGGGCHVERRQGGLREEEMRGSRTFARKEASGTETEEIRAPGVCTLFRVSARAGNMTAVTSA